MRPYVLLLAGILFFVSTNQTRAAVDSYEGTLLSTQLVSGSTLIVSDQKFSQMLTGTADFTVHRATNRVILAIDESSTAFHSVGYKVDAELEVSYLDAANTPHVITPNIHLSVDYDPAAGATHRDKSVYQFLGGHATTVEIVNITTTDPNGDSIPLPNEVMLKVQIDVERYYDFAPTDLVVVNGFAIANYNSATGSGAFQLAWNPLPRAEEYDVEFLYVDDYDDSGAPLSAGDLNYDFRHNATRITTREVNHTFSLVFERGYIVFRIRGIGRDPFNLSQRLEGNWNIPESGKISAPLTSGNAILVPDGHHTNLNWQYSATYAEEGKTKEVLSYFDGSLRKHQDLTRLSTENRILVRETFYDYQGRAVIQTLPAPTLGSVLQYQQDFNLSQATGKAYTHTDFDLDDGTCLNIANPMSTLPNGAGVGGASNYYSPDNPDKSGYNASIPDAFGFPFTHVEYMPDNTGRIRRQGGPGLHHKLNSGHETMYWYGKPTQRELDRLFGSEAGYDSHYQKNMVRDANGQVSVSYLDLKGRVVATALAGAAPANLLPLSSNHPGKTVTDSLLNGGHNNLLTDNGFSRTYSSSFLVSSGGPHTFSYTVQGAQFSDPACLGSVCYDCIYDLEISIQDLCPTEQIDLDGDGKTEPILQTIGDVPFDATCAIPPAQFNTTFEVDLDVGSYQILKKLTIDRNALEYYTDHYIENNTCLLTLDDFINTEMSRIDTTDCEIECDDCVQKLGPYSDYTGPDCEPCLDQAEYDQLVADCQEDCQPFTDACRAAFEAMLADVSPGGQYAKFGINPSKNIYASDQMSLILTMGLWKFPNSPYHNDDGSQAYIYRPDGTQVLPENGTIREFIDHFQPSWALSLVEYHPEYCYYDWCSHNNQKINGISSNEYDYNMLTTGTYDDAFNAGYINPLGDNNQPYNIATLDPYFQPGGNGNGQYMQMRNKMDQYAGPAYTMWDAAAKFTNASATFGQPAADEDTHWGRFRTLYLSEKQKLQQIAVREHCKTDSIDIHPYGKDILDPRNWTTH